MASFKQIKFYLLLLSGIAISLIGIYIFFSSSVAGNLLNLSKLSYTPSIYSHIFGQDTQSRVVTITSTTGQRFTLNTAVASTEAQREQGLMNVTTLPQGQGMLFIFQGTPQAQTFWMKNTKIPLDMIFLNENKTVVHIAQDALPCTTDPCTLYSSVLPTQYVIETNANWTTNNGITPGAVANF